MMKHSFWIFAGLGFAAIGAVAACGGDGGSGGGGTGGSGTSSSSTSSSSSSTSTSSSTSSSSSSSSTGAPCGGKMGGTCATGTYCDWTDGSCGAFDSSGTCQNVPVTCPLEAVPWQVCGCDGVVYGDVCSAAMAGVDLGPAEHCPLQPQQFACGSFICDMNQYCQVTKSDVGGEPDVYQCVFLPSACANAVDCACVATEPCGSLCTKETDGHLIVTCPGG